MKAIGSTLSVAFAAGLLAMLVPAAAWALNPISVTVSRSGLDSSAMSAHERFEITYDGLARWETSAFGESTPGCANQGGSFQGRVSSDQAAAIAKLAKETLAGQPAKPRKPLPGPRKVSNSIWVDFDGSIESGDVTTASPAYDALTKAIEELKTTLRPNALVVMRAIHSKKGWVKVAFDLAGDKPVTILIPDKPMETFKIGDAVLEYDTPHKDDSQLDLTPRARHGEVLLKVAERALGATSTVLYTDAVNLHHGKGDALVGDRMPPELSLCASLESRERPAKSRH